jgi:[ribosomal protein S5]-alanine N-acetyltransferase
MTVRASVTIRPPVPADAQEWIARVRASRRLHRPWISMPDTPAVYAEYMERGADPARAFRVICRRDDGAIVGFANLSEIIRGKLQQAFLGYGAFAGFEGQGYITAGLSLVLADAFGPLKLHLVEANIQPENLASKAVAQRVGFTCEGFSPGYLKVGGRWCDHERWAINADQWRAHRLRR